MKLKTQICFCLNANFISLTEERLFSRENLVLNLMVLRLSEAVFDALEVELASKK